MRSTFCLKALSVAIATFSVASTASAAGLDRSGQDVTAFFQDGTYAEAVYTYIDADVTGNDNAYVGTSDTAYVTSTSNGNSHRYLELSAINSGTRNDNQLVLSYIDKQVGIGTNAPDTNSFGAGAGILSGSFSPLK